MILKLFDKLDQHSLKINKIVNLIIKKTSFFK